MSGIAAQVEEVRPARETLPAGRVRLRFAWAAGALVLLFAAIVCGVAFGPSGLSVTRVARELLGLHSGFTQLQSDIVWQIRLPRVALGVLVGGTLALAGSAYQGVFRNPLADPYLLGVAAGAGLGATIAIAYGIRGHLAGIDTLPLLAFVAALAAVACTYAVGRSAGGSVASLLLAGITVAAFCTALQTYIQQHHVDQLQLVYSFILGGLGGADWADVRLVAPYVAVSTALILFSARKLDVLALGDVEAASLGVNVRRVRLVVVLAATIGTAAVVGVSGLIGFVGIIVPHLIRLALGVGSQRVLLPLSLLVGGAFVVGCDLVARTIEAPAELPIGVITAFIGAPFFAVVLRNCRGLT